MSERGRNLFDQYIVGLLATAEFSTSQLEANCEALRSVADASDIRISEIEEEVGGLKDALRKRLDLPTVSTPEARLESRVADLKFAAAASELRISKIEQQVDALQDSRKDS
jgi:hypothetical protein